MNPAAPTPLAQRDPNGADARGLVINPHRTILQGTTEVCILQYIPVTLIEPAHKIKHLLQTIMQAPETQIDLAPWPWLLLLSSAGYNPTRASSGWTTAAAEQACPQRRKRTGGSG